MEINDLISPRLQMLRHALEDGQATALDLFWQEIEEQGEPLFEPIEGDDQNMQELLCNSAFNRFLIEELLPQVHAQYNVTNDPARTLIAGPSRNPAGARFGARSCRCRCYAARGGHSGAFCSRE
jgi:hypothetical protein